MAIQLEPGWLAVLEPEFEKTYMQELKRFLQNEKAQHKIVFPPAPLIFQALNLCPFEKVKVVILGQDPYHGTGQAHGLSFSVPEGIPLPPSLRNIYKEIFTDLKIQAEASGKVQTKASGKIQTEASGKLQTEALGKVQINASGDLSKWASQGVLLLNSILTVRATEAGSHQKKGWEQFTDSIIHNLSEKRDGLVFILWGAYARSKQSLIDVRKHNVLESAHPSPLSAHNGFFGSRPFSKANELLEKKGQMPIEWNL